METKLSKPQVKVLRELSLVNPLGAITREEVSNRIGYVSSVPVYQCIGWPSIEQRTKWENEKGIKSLLSLGYVEEVKLEVEGRIEVGVRITKSGRNALSAVKEAERAKQATEQVSS